MNDVAPNPHVLSHKARLSSTQQPSASSAVMASALSGLLTDVGPREVFQALVQMLPHAAVFAVDADRNLLCWNDGAERMLGFKREEVLGRYCLTANRCHQCMLGCGISEYGAVTDVPLVLLNAAGEHVLVRKTARAFFDAERRFIGGLEVLVADEPAPPVGQPSVVQHITPTVSPPTALAVGSPLASRADGQGPQAVLRKLPSPRTLTPEELKLKVQEALLRSDGHIGRACELLGVSRPTLWRWRRRFEIDV